MATGTGGGGGGTASSDAIGWTDSDGSSRSVGAAAREDDTGTLLEGSVDLEFEWFQLCHGCGDRKWYNALICDDCRERHGV